MDSVTEFLVHYLFVFAGLFKDEESRNPWLHTGKASLVAVLAFDRDPIFYASEFHSVHTYVAKSQ